VADYRETAAKFQKEWHVQEPHRHFEFAPHVKSHALVSVVNRGLLYYAIERERAKIQVWLPQHVLLLRYRLSSIAMSKVVARPRRAPADRFRWVQVPRDAAAVAEAMQPEVGVFGPLITQAPPKVEEDAEGEIEDVEIPRKRQTDSRPTQHLLNGSPAKRQRLSNGYENGADLATTPMEVDLHHHTTTTTTTAGDSNHAYPSPLEGEQAATPIPRTEGPEQGTQVEKVEELAPETTFLRLMPDDSPDAASDSPSPASGENAPILLHCEWNPNDPSILAAAGTDALARVWTISRATAPEPDSGHVNGVNRPFHSLIDDETPKNAPVTAIAWNWDGTAIAVATEHSSKARINIWAPDGSHIHRFDVAEPPIIKLRWSPNNVSLLAIAPDNGGALVTVYNSATSNTLSYPLPGHDLNNWPLDAAWTNSADFLLCGGDVLLSLKCTDSAIVLGRKFETRSDDNFTQVLFDWRSMLAATSSDKGVLDVSAIPC
jgi:transducin (beta)-like 1